MLNKSYKNLNCKKKKKLTHKQNLSLKNKIYLSKTKSTPQKQNPPLKNKIELTV